MSIKVLFAPTWELARPLTAAVSIEAEYGSNVKEGDLHTGAHHQRGQEDAPAPSNDPSIPTIDSGNVVISHVDPDTIGGCLRTFADFAVLFSKSFDSFWSLVEVVDKKGFQRITECGASENDILRYYALRAWCQDNPLFPPNDVVTDVTRYIVEAGERIALILSGDEAVLDDGRNLLIERARRNEQSFKGVVDGVIVRESDGYFCNDLYRTPDGEAYDAVATYNTAKGSVTLSISDPMEGLVLREFVQTLWGDEAGGHPTIAGSPRGLALSREDFSNAVAAFVSRLQ